MPQRVLGVCPEMRDVQRLWAASFAFRRGNQREERNAVSDSRDT